MDYFFRVKRDGKFESVNFPDLTEKEREHIMERMDEESLKCLCCEIDEMARREE